MVLRAQPASGTSTPGTSTPGTSTPGTSTPGTSAPAPNYDTERLVAAFEGLVRLTRHLSPRDLSFTTVTTLGELQRGGPQRLTDLAAAGAVTQPAMTQLVSRLEEAGLVARAADPADRRVVRVALTAGGRAVLARRRAGRIARLAGLIDQLEPVARDALVAALPAIETLTRLGLEEPPPADPPRSAPGAAE